ncbi:MAG TPA: ABC transporter permease subunit [Candidatus Krumholzibacteria bacterium]|nr:ABC transporter permease subunit [Candidatus Krumholzibacteria bacterium]HPD70486.1 ABC transporter permease subunit [Candidatus Krumholzibacteria bacterium]HRY39814.1 ABC transporter permease subunit [Candidatus Krumholzibacteria bacterium]
MAGENRNAGNGFTGRRRLRKPKATVVVADRVARSVITLGGIGGIGAVSLVGLFLVYVAAPLFLPSRLDAERAVATGEPPAGVVHVAVDESATMAWAFHRDGSVLVRDLRDGRTIHRLRVPDGPSLTCWSFSLEGDRCALGYADGSVRLGTLGFATEYVDADDVRAAGREPAIGEAVPFRRGMVERTPEDQFRYREIVLALGEPLVLAAGTLVRIDQSRGPGGSLVAALDVEGRLHVGERRERRNLLTGELATQVRGGSLDLRAAGLLPAGGIAPSHLLLTGLGDNVMLAWPDGRLLRVDTTDPADPQPAGEVDLVPEAGRRLTAIAFQSGKASLVTGDDLGRVRVWFRVKDPEGDSRDGTALVLAHDLSGIPAVATAITPSVRTRMVAVGFADGTAALYHLTSERRLVTVDATGDGEPVEFLALAPRDDLLYAQTGGAARIWRIVAPHPEASWRALAGKIWYEGYGGPAWIWQSSAATDSFEPKYSLMPLVFGTLKATFYSLLFGLPLAWLAALYTSEFLAPGARSRVKPVIESMASLPSVVLGFLAALVFAPALERWVPESLTAVVTIPFAFLLGAHLWQLLPREIMLRRSRCRLGGMVLGLPAGLWLAFALGPTVERTLFAGDITAWLAGQVGEGTGGWMLLLLPLSAVAVVAANVQIVDGWLRNSSTGRTAREVALLDLLRFLLSSALAVALAWGGASLFAAMALDPRGGFLDTYVQRNALVVGMVMGFAIIPIIYTISEDALAAVPGHLRAASLGAGATPWQTALRVVVPTALSGLFSAMMIGLGRAVGETMIVLMAAGNTPIMEWNVFNGFRTLSANVAVEMPEAVQNSTHYRMLFLAALTLFVLTFLLNTVAEAVRTRFRRKSLQL